MFYILYCVYLFVSICLVNASIEVFDRYGRKVDSFQDREAVFDDDFLTIEGFLVAADPSDACTPLAPPTFMTNFTINKFVLVNGSDVCGFMTKVRNVEDAGYDVAVVYEPAMPFAARYDPFPNIEIKIQVVFVTHDDGMEMKHNYLYNHSSHYNYLIKLRPNTPDITYYMYLFGAVIGVCFFVMVLFMFCLLVKCIQEKRRNRRNRLSRLQIRQIPTAKYSKGDQYDVCAICLEDYNEGDKLRILPCSHAYHAKCIDPWLLNNRRNCPLCKRKITFGDEDDDTDSEDSEMTSPTENTPLLTPSSRPTEAWGTFAGSRAPDGSGPSSLPDRLHSPPSWQTVSDDELSDNPFSTANDTDNLLPPPHSSINNCGEVTPNVVEDVVVRNVAGGEASRNSRGLFV